jgi:hypothetical protein
VRTLKAHRDGLRDSVNYWADRIGRENSAGLDFETIHAAAQKMTEEDRSEISAARSVAFRSSVDPRIEVAYPPLYGYWCGRQQVDINIPNFGPDRIVQRIDDWKKKIDNDTAMKALDAAFPPVSPSTTAAKDDENSNANSQ